MAFFVFLSDFMLPMTIFLIVAYALGKGRPVYDDFVEGAKKGLRTVVEIAPTVIGLMTMVAVLRASGLFDLLTRTLSPLTERLHFPAPLLPLALIRLVSSSAANGMVTDIFAAYGPDSYMGTAASILMGCTESAFYTLSVYFVSVRISHTRYSLAGALLATAAGVGASIFLAGIL